MKTLRQLLKKSIRMMKSHRNDAKKVSLIEGKKIGINEVIKRNEIINKFKIINTCKNV